MSKEITAASWIGKAAYEIRLHRAMNGGDAYQYATAFHNSLINFGQSLAANEPRQFIRDLYTSRTGKISSGAPQPDTAHATPGIVRTKLSITIDDDGDLEIQAEGAKGLYGDRCISWDFASAIVAGHKSHNWDDAHGYRVETINEQILVTMPATIVRHGITFILSIDQAVVFGGACIEAVNHRTIVDIATVDARWDKEPISPVVRARITERLRKTA